LGNDSALALSTAFVGSGTTAISNWQLFKGFQTIGGNSFVGYEDQAEIWSNSFYDGAFKYYANGYATRLACIDGELDFNNAPLNTSGAGAAATFTNRLKITTAGNVGIGTTAPEAIGAGITHVAISGSTTGVLSIQSGATRILSLSTSGTNAVIQNRSTGSIIFAVNAGADEICAVTANGLTFNGDTAAANALDDYEEGTWTPTLGGTWSTNPTALSGVYTKIGNMVYIRLEFTGGVKASNTSGWFDGLPFSGAVGGGGTVSNVSVEDKGIVLLDNLTRVWTTVNDFGGVGTKVMASYRL
jgi:hypothetical protein